MTASVHGRKGIVFERFFVRTYHSPPQPTFVLVAAFGPPRRMGLCTRQEESQGVLPPPPVDRRFSFGGHICIQLCYARSNDKDTHEDNRSRGWPKLCLVDRTKEGRRSGAGEWFNRPPSLATQPNPITLCSGYPSSSAGEQYLSSTLLSLLLLLLSTFFSSLHARRVHSERRETHNGRCANAKFPLFEYHLPGRRERRRAS